MGFGNTNNLCQQIQLDRLEDRVQGLEDVLSRVAFSVVYKGDIYQPVVDECSGEIQLFPDPQVFGVGAEIQDLATLLGTDSFLNL